MWIQAKTEKNSYQSDAVPVSGHSHCPSHRLHSLSLTAFSLFTACMLHFPLFFPSNQMLMLTHGFYSLPTWAGLWFPSCSHLFGNHASQLRSHSSAQVLCCVIWARISPILSISSDWGRCGHRGLQNTASSGRDLGNWLLSEGGFWCNRHSESLFKQYNV